MKQKQTNYPEENAVGKLRELYRKNRRSDAPKELVDLFRKEKKKKRDEKKVANAPEFKK